MPVLLRVFKPDTFLLSRILFLRPHILTLRHQFQDMPLPLLPPSRTKIALCPPYRPRFSLNLAAYCTLGLP